MSSNVSPTITCNEDDVRPNLSSANDSLDRKAKRQNIIINCTLMTSLIRATTKEQNQKRERRSEANRHDSFSLLIMAEAKKRIQNEKVRK
jgi:hypothetical protein